MSGEPWRDDTMVVVHSTTKGLAAMVMALAHSRGWLDYDERVCTYWPEFAQAGKERITVRQLLAHQAGLFAFDEKVDRDVVADLDRLAEIMARQRPAWEPGERQAYHAISLGFYEGELVRRIDPEHRSLGRVFDEEIAKPLGIDFYIGVPDVDPRRPPGAARAAQSVEAADRDAAAAHAGRDEPALGRSTGRWSPTPGRRSTSTRSGWSCGTWRCPRAAASAPRARSRGRTACSPAAAASSGCAPRRSRR